MDGTLMIALRIKRKSFYLPFLKIKSVSEG